MSETGPDEDGALALNLAEWAGKRISAPIEVTGREPELTQVRRLLAADGVATVPVDGGSTGRVSLRWSAPDTLPVAVPPEEASAATSQN